MAKEDNLAAKLPLTEIRMVHSFPTYNFKHPDLNKETGVLGLVDGIPYWLVKRHSGYTPANYWAGFIDMPAWDETLDWGAYHGAVDILPERKENKIYPVFAMFPGQVVQTHQEGNHSNRIITLTNLFPDISFITIYQHLAPELRVEKGDAILAGYLIGSLGIWEGKLSGNEHLHAEVISKKRLSGIPDAFCVPCPGKSGTANSQYTDAIFAEWVELPYTMSNAIKVIEVWNKYVTQNDKDI